LVSGFKRQAALLKKGLFIGPQAVKFQITNRELILRTDATRREVLLLLV